MKQNTLSYLVSTKMSQKGYTVSELSEVSKISKPSIYNILKNNTKRITSTTFSKLVNALEFNKEEIEDIFEYLSY